MPPELTDVPEAWPVAESRLEYDGGGWVVKLRNDRIRRQLTSLTSSAHVGN